MKVRVWKCYTPHQNSRQFTFSCIVSNYNLITAWEILFFLLLIHLIVNSLFFSVCLSHVFTIFKKSHCVVAFNVTANFGRFHLLSPRSGLLWWWPALGETSPWSRSCCATAQTRHWETKTAGTPFTSPAGRAIPWSYSTCFSQCRMSGGRRAKRAGLRCTLQVRRPQIQHIDMWRDDWAAYTKHVLTLSSLRVCGSL